VLGILPGVVGVIQATEAIKLILGVGDVLKGRLLTYDSLKMTFRTLKLRRDKTCPTCGDNPDDQGIHRLRRLLLALVADTDPDFSPEDRKIGSREIGAPDPIGRSRRDFKIRNGILERDALADGSGAKFRLCPALPSFPILL
jgi:hypothetical protein